MNFQDDFDLDDLNDLSLKKSLSTPPPGLFKMANALDFLKTDDPEQILLFEEYLKQFKKFNPRFGEIVPNLYDEPEERKVEEDQGKKKLRLNSPQFHISESMTNQAEIGPGFVRTQAHAENFVALSTDKFQESKSLQCDYENGDDAAKEAIFKKCCMFLFDMVKDKYYNYVIQKILECNHKSHAIILFSKLKDMLYELQMDKYGSRVFQKMIEVFHVHGSPQFNALFAYIKGNLEDMFYHENGNFVVQKCLEIYTTVTLSFLLEKITDKVPSFP